MTKCSFSSYHQKTGRAMALTFCNYVHLITRIVSILGYMLLHKLYIINMALAIIWGGNQYADIYS